MTDRRRDEMLPQRVSGVVFDCDGLLVDTEECWSRAQAGLFAQHGRAFGPAEKAGLIGRSVADVCDFLAEEFGLPGQSRALEAEMIRLVTIEFEHLVSMPGAVALLESLVGRVPLAVATNSTRAMLDDVLTRTGLIGYFDASVAVDEVAQPKPNPDVYLAAFGKLGADPATGLALEDSHTGMLAARRAGARVAVVPSLPDSIPDGDFEFTSLADAALRNWAADVTVA